MRRCHYQQAFLLGASYVFYWTTSNYFVILLLFITIISFQAGEFIHHTSNPTRKKIIFIVALISLLIPLGIFKYYNFGLEIVNQIPLPINYYLNLPILGLILPIGISFFTFSAISYVVDIYRETIPPEEHFYRYALFVSYFPHLLAGPIVRAGQFLPQLKHSISICPENLKAGVTLILWGFLKKFVIADNIAPMVNCIFANPTNFTSAYIIVGTIFFGIQIYCDFSGYIDIALGAAKLIGLHLPQNFFRPYLSKSPTEFWRRWNITLSSFIRDYIYIPLGGNRKGNVRTYFNLEFSMLLCGLWHGAAWNFVIWGGYHGILLSVHKILKKQRGSLLNLFPTLDEHFGLFIKIIITQYFIFLGWIMFRVGNISDMLYCMKKYILIDFNFYTIRTGQPALDFLMDDVFFTWSLKKAIVVLIIVIIITSVLFIRREYFMKKGIHFLTNDWIKFISLLPLKYWLVCLTTMIFICLCFSASSSPVFIYYQF
jgi:D-alanyl-lipoteichoic acid acyltransferase DltB (MBOAT superfamily)